MCPCTKRAWKRAKRGALSLIAKYWRSINRDGFRVTGREVLVRNRPLLRGPWRAGDRLMLAGALYLLIAPASLVCHAEVVAADAEHLRLACDLWGGVPLPIWHGTAELRIESDPQGVAALHLTWRQIWKTHRREGRIDVIRKDFHPMPATSPAAAGP